MSNVENPGVAELCGTWKLVEATRRVVNTDALDKIWGRRPSGLVTYGADGRVFAIVAYDDRVKPESFDKSTADEERKLYKSMLAFAGTYTFDGKTINHKVDISWNECWTGKSLLRHAKIMDSQLTLVTVPFRWADGIESVITSVWKRAW